MIQKFNFGFIQFKKIFNQLEEQGIGHHYLGVPRKFELSSPVGVALGDTFWKFFFIGPKSDHWECLSVTNLLTDWLTHCRLINLIDVNLACEDGNWKLGEVVTVVDVDDEKQFTP